jgi:putative NIF3 family GTP cyclohydrolase 1 type 2
MIGFEGFLSKEQSLDNIVQTLCEKLDTECTVLPFGSESVSRIAIVSGGASGELTEAIEKGIECYVTGEPGHANYHEALEAGINVIYCGHYHSETLGVKALGKLIENKFGIETVFLDIPTVI